MNDTVLTVLAQVAEQLGFLTPTGPGEAAPPDALCIAVGYTGPAQGTVLVAASPALAEALARNLMALDADAPVAADDRRDALHELANVVAGNLLPQLLGDGEFHLAAPAAAAWDDRAAQAAALECAEGWLAAACLAS